MVTHFGHISAIGSDTARVPGMLTHLPAKPQSVQQVVGEALAARGLALQGYQLPPANQPRGGIARTGTYFCGPNGPLVTIWNDDFSLWNVEYLAREMSRFSPETIVGAALTDGVFILVLEKRSECLTRHVWGATGPRIEKVAGDAGVFAEAFGIPEKKAEIALALQNDDQDAQIETLEQLFGIRLRLGNAEELTKAGWQKVVADS